MSSPEIQTLLAKADDSVIYRDGKIEIKKF